MFRENSYQDLKNKYGDYIIIIKAGCFYDVRDFGALFFSDKLGYTLYSDKSSFYKIGIPILQIDKAIEIVKANNYKYLVVESYQVIEQYKNGISAPIIDTNNTASKENDNTTNCEREIKIGKSNQAELREQIKDYRLNIAREKALPIYCIFQNKAINSLVENLPTSMSDLYSILGLGETTIERYGQDIIDIIKNYIENHPEIEKLEIKPINNNFNTDIGSQSNIEKVANQHMYDNLQEAFDKISEIINNNKQDKYTSDFFENVLNISSQISIVYNEQLDIPLNNLMYLYAQKTKGIIYQKDDDEVFLTRESSKNNKYTKNIIGDFESFIDENDANKIIEISQNKEYNYDTKLSMIQMEFGEMQYEHTNFEGIGSFGSLNQYILEAYCILNVLTTRKWISANKINSDLLVAEAEAIEFQLVKQNNKVIQYSLYNLAQTCEYQEQYKTKVLLNDTDVIVSRKELIDSIIGLISKFDGILGRIATVKILTGEFEDKDKHIRESEYYGKFPNKYGNALSTIISKLIKNNRLGLNSKYKLCCIPTKQDEEKTEDGKDFKKIVQYIKNGKNIFVTGNAGTGKSYLLNKLKAMYKKRLELTSTTGLAAVNIKGVTIHSWAGVGICKKDISKCVSDILEKRSLASKIKNCELLAIDEVSMLKGHTFSYIDQVLRMVRDNDEPFGGIQLLLFGDFFQLPPVEEENNNKSFCFETQTWQDLNLEIVKLETIYRQTETSFIKVLNNIRTNNIDKNDINILKSREITYDTSESTMLHIFSRNDEADGYNRKKFEAIESKIYQYNAISGVYRGDKFIQTDLTDKEKMALEIFKKNCRASETLYLKNNCRVMLLVNLDFDKGLINGACGEITSLSNDGIIILFDNGVEANIEPNKFEYYYNDILQATMTQYPLKLAYAITIHKSQGMTLENVVVDCKRIFEEGQAYVALSRVKKISGLYLKGFSPEKIKVNKKVVDFYNEI